MQGGVDTRAGLTRWASLLAAVAATSCVGPQQPAKDPTETIDVTVGEMVVDWDEESSSASLPEDEPGFRYCCGNGLFKMEIDCSGMLKRCYQHLASGWRQTYGRFCKEELGQACYLEQCEARCK